MQSDAKGRIDDPGLNAIFDRFSQMTKAQSGPNRRARAGARAAILRSGPDFSRETLLAKRLSAAGPIIGIDEVGRGPFAGPVMAAAAWLSAVAAERLAEAGLDDSKKLTAKRRAALADEIVGLAAAGEALVALGAASVREIETRNILGATGLAMRRAALRFAFLHGAPPAFALIDGNRAPDGLPCPAETVVGGDGAALSIAAAALYAKESRDRLMRRLALRYPGYQWERNAGYGGSPAHRAAILALGLTPHHRRGFCRRLLEEAEAQGAPEREKTDGPGADGENRRRRGRRPGTKRGAAA